MKIALNKLDYEVNLISFHFINIWIIIPLNISFKIASLLLCSHSVMSDFSWPHGLQHARLPCPSPSPRTCSNSCPLHRWCHPTVSSSVIPFSCLQSFSASGSLWLSSLHQMAKVLELHLQHQSFQWTWFPLGWTDWISLQSKGLSRVFSNTIVQFFGAQLSLHPTLPSIHDYWKNHSLN